MALLAHKDDGGRYRETSGTSQVSKSYMPQLPIDKYCKSCRQLTSLYTPQPECKFIVADTLLLYRYIYRGAKLKIVSTSMAADEQVSTIRCEVC